MLQKSFVGLQINQISTNFDLFNSLTKRVLPNDNSASLQLFIEIQLVLALTKFSTQLLLLPYFLQKTGDRFQLYHLFLLFFILQNKLHQSFH